MRVLAVLFAILPAACVRTAPPEPGERTETVARPSIDDVVNRNAPELMRIPGVTMVYVGEEKGAPCIGVGFVSLPSPEQGRVPERIEGWPVRIEETGEIRPLDDGD